MRIDRLRFVLSWTLIVLFVTTTALVLFLTFGYRWSADRGIFIYTGSTTIKSNPRTVDIFLDGKKVPNGMLNIINQSMHVAGIQPGEHFIRVEAAGFKPWEKKISVGSGISTEFWNIILPRQEYPMETISTDRYEQAFPSPDGATILFSGTEGERIFINALDKISGESTLVFESDRYRFSDNTLENIELSWSDQERILVPVTDDRGATILIIDRETGETTDIRDIAPITAPSFARWHPTDERAFFVLSGDSDLYVIRPKESLPEKRAVLLSSGISAYDLSQRYLYTLEAETGIVYRSAYGNEEEFGPDPITPPIESIIGAETPVLTVYDERRVAVYDLHGKGILYNDDGGRNPAMISLGDAVEGVQFSDDGKKLLFYSENEISVAFTRDWEVQPVRSSGDVLQIARFSSPLSSAQWTEDYEHILFGIGGEVKIAELDHRDRRQMETLIPIPTGSTLVQALSSFGEDRIYLLTRNDQGDASFSFITFPEETGIFVR